MDESFAEKLVSSSYIYRGKVCKLRKDTVVLPDGRIVDREIVDHPGAVAIIPVVDEKIVLIRQFRQAAGKVLYELPAGTLEMGEDPDTCAARELKEETGYVCENLRRLFKCYLAPGYSTEVIHFYLATDLKPGVCWTDQDEFIDVLKVTIGNAMQMIETNEIDDAKTICGILMLIRLGKKFSLKT